MLIGIAGKADVGKDTLGEFLKEHYFFYQYAFADPIKKAASIMFDIPLVDFYDKQKKEEINPYWGFSPRYIAQILGTDFGRNTFRRDIWLKRAEAEMQKVSSLQNGMVITDVRFPNEVDWIHERGGIIIKLAADWSTKVLEHESESYELELTENDFFYCNDSTKEELYDFGDYVMETFRIKGVENAIR